MEGVVQHLELRHKRGRAILPLSTFDSGAENTYLYGGDGGSSTTASQATAASNPFTLRNRPAWLFHAGNRVISPGSDDSHNNVDFWIKIGYIGKDSSLDSRWADHASLYYTTDGSTPAGSLGVASGTSQAAALSLDHPEDDTSPAGNAMWWKGAVANLPTFTTIKYKLGAWHSSNNEEKFADYNAGTPNSVYSFTMGTTGDPVLTVNGLNADYTTTHVFVDENARGFHSPDGPLLSERPEPHGGRGVLKSQPPRPCNAGC